MRKNLFLKGRESISGAFQLKMTQSNSRLRRCIAISLAVLGGTLVAHSEDAPGLLWSTNVGARAFAVDTAGNSYASTNGNVIVIDANGGIVGTNTICPKPGIMARDG